MVGALFLVWSVAIAFGAVAIRADLIIRYMRWLAMLQGLGTEKTLGSSLAKIWVRGIGTIGAVGAGSGAIVMTISVFR